MGRNETPKTPDKGAALLVVVARHPRTEKVKQLTARWSDAEWRELCVGISAVGVSSSFLPERGLVLLPDLEMHGTIARSQVRSLVREVFEQHRRHSSGSAIVVLNPFSADGIADAYFQHFLNLFITLHEMEGRVLMLRCEDLESVPT